MSQNNQQPTPVRRNQQDELNMTIGPGTTPRAAQANETFNGGGDSALYDGDGNGVGAGAPSFGNDKS